MPLAPANECGVHKFICTALHPSLPPCPELYSLEGCAKFVSEFLAYEPLANPLHPPTHLPSPMSVLAWQTADSFDASMVLCSLLLGAGYNAFVVMGYAQAHVTVNDQSQVELPAPVQQPQQQGQGKAQQAGAAWWAAPVQRGSTGAAVEASSSHSTSGKSRGALQAGWHAAGKRQRHTERALQHTFPCCGDMHLQGRLMNQANGRSTWSGPSLSC